MTQNVFDDSPGAVSLADEDRVKQVLLNSIMGLWDVVNDLTRLQPLRRERYRVTIFGSARTMVGSPIYEETKRTAAALAEMGCDIITGGGPGLMRAANEGAAPQVGPCSFDRNTSGPPIRAGYERVRDKGVSASHIFYTPPPVCTRLGCVCCRSGRNRNRS